MIICLQDNIVIYEMSVIILAGLLIIVLVLFIGLMSKKNNVPKTERMNVGDSSTLESSLTNVSNQISSYLGFDPTGGRAPYNSTTFQQYLSDSIQLLNQEQSSGSVSPQFGQYLGHLLKEIQTVSPLDQSSFDEENIGTIAGSLFLCVLSLQNGIKWEPEGSNLIQDVIRAAELYDEWLSGKKSATDAAKYLNDPIIYNLKMDSEDAYPTGTIQVLNELIDAATADVWYLTNNNLNKARAWSNLGMFEAFKCVFTEDGNTC